MKSIQQGDCILEYVAKLPKEAKKVAFNGIVLKGEGVNTHELTDLSTVETYEVDGALYLSLSASNTLKHQEHGVETLTPGIIKRRIEREWDYESEEVRNTRD